MVGALEGSFCGVLAGDLAVYHQGYEGGEEVVVTPSTDASGLVGVDLGCVTRLVA